MKRLILIITLIFCVSKITAQKLYTKEGETIFDGSKESFEPIKATNNNSVSIIDTDNGNIAALIYIKAVSYTHLTLPTKRIV